MLFNLQVAQQSNHLISPVLQYVNSAINTEQFQRYSFNITLDCLLYIRYCIVDKTRICGF